MCKPLPLIQSRASQTNHHPLTTQLTSFPGPAITTTANVAAAKTANPPTSTAPGHTVRTHTRDWNPLARPPARPPVMSSKYAFTKSLKEVRFLFCQTSEHSAAVRYVFSCCAGTPSSSPSSSPVSPPLRPEAEAEHLSLAVDARARCVVRPRAALVVNGRCTRGTTGIRVQLARSEHNGRRGTGTKKDKKDKSGKLTRARSRRSFLLRAYPTMKKNNPNTPIMIREAAGTLPKIFARYGSSPLPLLPPLLPPLPPSLHPPAPTPPPPPLPRLPNARRKQHHHPPNPSRTLTPC